MKPSLSRLIKYFYKPYTFWLIGISLCGILFVLFEIINIAAVFPIVNSVVSSSSAQSGNPIIGFIQKTIQIVPIKDKFIAIFVLFLVVNILLNLFRYFYQTLTEISS